MKLPDISTRIKRLATLDMPVEALKVLLLDLAVELDLVEARLSLDRERKRPGNSKELSENSVETPRKIPDIPAVAPVLDITSTSKQEVSKEKGNLTVSQKALTSKPLPSDPQGFTDFWETYPKRSGGSGRPAAVKCFGAQLKRGIAFGTIMDGARRYRAHCDAEGKTGTQYVLKARTWLNESGWTENYENHKRSPKPGSIAAGFAIIDDALAAEERAIREEEERQRSGEADADELPGLRQIN